MSERPTVRCRVPGFQALHRNFSEDLRSESVVILNWAGNERATFLGPQPLEGM